MFASDNIFFISFAEITNRDENPGEHDKLLIFITVYFGLFEFNYMYFFKIG